MNQLIIITPHIFPQQYVPVHVMPKLEYQLSYGVECLTNSEACQLWAETLLHSSTVSYIGTNLHPLTGLFTP